MKKFKFYYVFFLSAAFILFNFSNSFGNDVSAAAPIISEMVEKSLGQDQKVRVLIKLKDESDFPHISKMTNAKEPSRFISKGSIKRLQDKVISSFSAEEQKNEIRIVHKLENIPWITGKITRKALEKLKNNPNVAMVSEDLPIKALLNQSGPLIGRDTAHNYGYTGEGINVAVLDTGIDTNHPDLMDDIILEKCFMGAGCPGGGHPAEDGDGHGTHVSGIITSSNSTYKGIAPDAGIVAIKVLDDTGNGFISDAAAGADWMITNGDAYNIRIVNMSFGVTATFLADCDKAYPPDQIPDDFKAGIELLEAARNAGVAVFAAAGNDAASSGLTAPACVSTVISVGSVYDANIGSRSCDYSTYADKIACYSNVASSLDILAPGSAIISSKKGGGTTSMHGTSMASPHAAGVAALMLDKNPCLTVDEIESIMKNTGKSIYDSRIGMSFPRINADDALNSVAEVEIHSYDADENYMIEDFELLDAIDDWAANNLGDFQLLDLIDMWAMGMYC